MVNMDGVAGESGRVILLLDFGYNYSTEPGV